VSAALSLTTAPAFTTCHGDRRFRIRPAIVVLPTPVRSRPARVAFATHHGDRKFRVRSANTNWRHWRTPLPSVAEARAFATHVRRQIRETGSVMLPCSAEVAWQLVELSFAIAAPERVAWDRRPWMAPPKRAVNTHWIVQACALQRYAEGRGPHPLPPPSKKYEPIPIVWGELPSDLRQAFERVSEALSWGRVIGEAGASHLFRLNQLYKRWACGRATAMRVAAEAGAFVSFVEAAPRPLMFVEPASPVADPVDAEAVFAAVRRLVAHAPAHVRERLEDEARTEALIGRFEPTDSTETRAKRAIWRVEARVREENNRRRNGRFGSEHF
jgi:hypothetical protein